MCMREYKESIEKCITRCYSCLESIDGENLHELGEWVDIVKDIAEMEYYESKALKNHKIVEAMDKHDELGNRSVDSMIQSLTNMVEEAMENMTDEQVSMHKAKLQQIIDNMR